MFLDIDTIARRYMRITKRDSNDGFFKSGLPPRVKPTVAAIAL